jgi:quinol monooxygenase YgiN
MKNAFSFAVCSTLLFLNHLYGQTKTTGMDKNYSVEIIRYDISQGERDNFEKAYAESGKYLQASKYCLGYEIIHGNEEPNNYIVIINWTSKEEHLQGFRKSAEFIPFFNLVKPFYNNIKEMKHYDLTPMNWKRE